ncbi:MAG TPA: hypothetical protein VF808_07505 [Ktedonobacterales bacterium]
MRYRPGVSGEALQWVKPRWTKPDYELRAGDVVIARLIWPRNSPPCGEWASGRYFFERTGWLRRRIVVHDASAADASAPVATLTRGDGALAYPDGRAYRWVKPQWWSAQRVWRDGADREIVRFAPHGSSSTVTAQPEADYLPDTPLLLTLGQYLLIIAAREARAAAAAAAIR